MNQVQMPILKLFLIILLIGGNIRAQSQDKVIRPFFIAIFVSHVDSSIAWYSKVLDLKLRNRTDNADRGFKQVILVGSGIMVELVELKRAIRKDSLLSGVPRGTAIQGFQKFGVAVTDIDGFHKKLQNMNISFYGSTVRDPIDNKRSFLISDPDGNLVQVFEE